MNIYYVYAYLRQNLTPYYIGKGKGIRAFRKKSNRGINPPIDKSRIVFLANNLTEQSAFDLETYFIRSYGRKDIGTGILRNRTNGGEGASGIVVSEETRRKLSEINKGKTLSKETRRKLSEINKGKTLSEETRRKIGEKSSARKYSEETKRKWSEQRKGRTRLPFSEEWKKNISKGKKGKIPWNKGLKKKDYVNKNIV